MGQYFSQYIANEQTVIHPDNEEANMNQPTEGSAGDIVETDSNVSLDGDDDDDDIDGIKKDSNVTLGEEDAIYIRIPCGIVRKYYGFHTFDDGSKILIDKNGNWRTGPFKNLEDLLVNKYSTDYQYVTPYEKDINGHIHKTDTGERAVCKNCLAYGKWEHCNNNIQICVERCLNCRNAEYQYKVLRIQRKWRQYKNIDTTFIWDWRVGQRGEYVPIIKN
tara:strand:+ start:1442 stop:2098 length:657 start_codon:yes stop_codon:yes gene_type:complete